MTVKRKRIVVSDLMQTEYTDYLTESIGRGFIQNSDPTAKKRLDLSGRSQRMVSVVLQVLYGPQMP